MNNPNTFKATSLQAWGKLTEKYLHKGLRIEDRKDREVIYAQIAKLGLPGEKLISLSASDAKNKTAFKKAVDQVGIPFWISATPLPGQNDVSRLTLLAIQSIEQGMDFVNSIEKINSYKILLIEYPTDIEFKGSALVSHTKKGIAEFALGDHHFELTAGSTLPDPLIFDEQGIKHYSSNIEKKYQDEIYSDIKNIPGHFEIQLGKLSGIKDISYFDFNDELAYEDIDETYNLLVNEFSKPARDGREDFLCKGMTASPGEATGTARVILNSELADNPQFNQGDILVTNMTAPDMTPLMAKAAAIVTDLGGVTCHAAIVCREMKIPCIVGARNATKVIRPGSEIEVQASQGVVR